MLENPDSFLTDTNNRIGSGDARLVSLGVVPTTNSDPPLLVRRLNYGRLLPRLRDLFRRSRAERAFKHGFGMEQAGLPTPRVFAAGIQRVAAWPLRAYLITEYVPNAQTLQERLAGQSGFSLEQARELVDLVVQLHAAGFTHGDLKAANLLYGGKGEPWLIDLDGARYYQTVPLVRMVFDLERLARNFPANDLTRHARWLLKRYCQKRGLRREFRRIYQLAMRRRAARLRKRRLLWRWRTFGAVIQSAVALRSVELDLTALV